MKRKHLIAAAALVLSLTLGLTAGVAAYLNDSGSMKNRLRSGSNQIEVKETYEPPAELKQGDNTFTKDVQVTNTGDTPCYVRVFLAFSDSATADHASLSVQPKEKNAGWTGMADFQQTPPSGWQYIPEATDGLLGGFFYWTEALQPGETTPFLLRSVRVNFPTQEDVQDFEIIVSAESVQIGDHLGVTRDWQTIWKEFLQRP